jgi:hypothetical protein
MTAFDQDYSKHTAPAGHVTFSVLDEHKAGHSAIMAAEMFPRVMEGTRKIMASAERAVAFSGARQILESCVGCADGHKKCAAYVDQLPYAFITALLKHPDKATGKKLLKGLSMAVKKYGGAHMILIAPPTGPLVWMISGPSKEGRV